MAITDEIVKLLTEFGKDTVPDLQRSLKSKLYQKASKYGAKISKTNSDLSDSIRFTFPAEGGGIKFTISMNEYGLAVDSGRKASPVSEEGIENLKDWARTYGYAQALRKKDLATRLEQQGKNKTDRKKKPLKEISFEKAVKVVAFRVANNLKKRRTYGNQFFSEIIKDGRVDELSAKLKELIKSEIRIEVISGLK